MIKVLIVEDNVITMAGLEQIIQTSEDIRVVGRAFDASSALSLAERTRPDVALVDMVLPDGDGISLARGLLALDAPPHVLVLTAFHVAESVTEALAAGVSGFLLKDLLVEDLLEGIRAADAGHSVLHPAVTRRLVDSVRSADHVSAEEEARFDSLTDREQAVLRLLARGLTNAAIGRQLGVSEATVKNNVAQLFTKLGLTSRVQLARFASRMGPRGEQDGQGG
ncbi:response regulator [Streptomyces sp. IBSNAI002]|uniref:response regulator n=1 Tax=Streptomyces sp. IBSNAI002 TaxID=3457500 RepID=UPI003FD5D6F0